MSTDEKDLVKAAIEPLVKPIADLVDKLAGPMATEIGSTLGDTARVYRFKRAVKLFEEVKKIAEEAGFEPQAVRPKLLLPVLDHASIEDDDDMGTRWAALLANAANPDADVEVEASFPEILNQLSPDQAKLLDRIFNDTLAHHEKFRGVAGPHPAYMQVVSPFTLSRSGLEAIYTGLGLTDQKLPMTWDSGPEASSALVRFQTDIDNLIRLELLRSAAENFSETTGTRPVDSYSVSALGVKFVAACRKPMSKASRKAGA